MNFWLLPWELWLIIFKYRKEYTLKMLKIENVKYTSIHKCCNLTFRGKEVFVRDVPHYDANRNWPINILRVKREFFYEVITSKLIPGGWTRTRLSPEVIYEQLLTLV